MEQDREKPETFCLKWNNFQQNIFSTIQNLRLDLDFLDVTIHCGGKQLKAHKVILSACSNTFRSILKDTAAPHPVIVLWDVEHRDVSALLDFMYNGQVEIHHDDLARFLEVASRLQVRGLTELDSGDRSRKRSMESTASYRPNKLPRSSDVNKVQTNSDHLIIHNHQPETRELETNGGHHRVEIKTEQGETSPETNVVNLPHRSPAHHQHGPIKKRNLIHEVNHHQNNINNTEADDYSAETVEYPGDNNGGDHYPLDQSEQYEEFYDEEGSYSNSAQLPIDYSMDNSPKSSKSVKCPYCDKVLKYRHNLKGHIQNQHGAGEPEAPCPICPDKIFKNAASLRDHMSRKHKAEKAAAATMTAVTAGAEKLLQAAAAVAATNSLNHSRTGQT